MNTKEPTLKIFAHKNFIGAETDCENGEFVNDIHGASQLGCVVSFSETEISEEAKELLSTAKREGGSFAPIMIMEDCIGVGGFNKHLFDLNDPILSRDCDLNNLSKIKVVENKPPQDFIEYIDSLSKVEQG